MGFLLLGIYPNIKSDHEFQKSTFDEGVNCMFSFFITFSRFLWKAIDQCLVNSIFQLTCIDFYPSIHQYSFAPRLQKSVCALSAPLLVQGWKEKSNYNSLLITSLSQDPASHTCREMLCLRFDYWSFKTEPVFTCFYELSTFMFSYRNLFNTFSITISHDDIFYLKTRIQLLCSEMILVSHSSVCTSTFWRETFNLYFSYSAKLRYKGYVKFAFYQIRSLYFMIYFPPNPSTKFLYQVILNSGLSISYRSFLESNEMGKLIYFQKLSECLFQQVSIKQISLITILSLYALISGIL